MKNENPINQISNFHILGTPQPRKSRINSGLAEQLNELYSKQPDNPAKKPKQETSQADINAPEKSGMIWVSSAKLYFSNERKYLGKNWFEAHKLAQAEGLKMPTIPEFLEFLKYLRSDSSYSELYKDITEVRNPWRANWLDADFKVKNKELCINYNHKVDSQGNLKPLNTEKLEACLMEDCYADILDYNRQGLPFPTKKTKNKEFYYWFPRSDNNSVATFSAYSDSAFLYCYRNPDGRGASLGVFVCAEGTQKNSGGKI
ncbi:MAG: hypothetical protein PHH54_01555 [Candidatus Nanoarchaeia archaeon]|nr:hypothetical protein [Candidatus Nanoarchaeia archaeon]MDD5740650.1 hypothetical protein [Candidatus Nanoarchaeia archaeon]